MAQCGRWPAELRVAPMECHRSPACHRVTARRTPAKKGGLRPWPRCLLSASGDHVDCHGEGVDGRDRNSCGRRRCRRTGAAEVITGAAGVARDTTDSEPDISEPSVGCSCRRWEAGVLVPTAGGGEVGKPCCCSAFGLCVASEVKAKG